MKINKTVGALILFAIMILSASTLDAQGKIRIAIIIAPVNFYDKEYIEPKTIFTHNKAEVIVASTTTAIAIGRDGLKVQPDVVISDLNADNFDAIVLIGGRGVIKYLWDNQKLQNLVKDANRHHKVIAAICLTPAILARAGILKGKNVTCYPDRNLIRELKKAGVNYIDKEIVVDGNIVTGNGPDSAKAFGLKAWEVINQFSKKR